MDIDAALKDGYSLAEVNAEAAKRVKFDYAGAKAGGYSDEEILGELRKRLKSPQKRQATWMESFKQGMGQVVTAADLSWSTLAGSAAALFGDEKEAQAIEKNRLARKAILAQWGNPQETEQSFLQKAANVVNPVSLISSGFSPATTVDTALQSGESDTSALKAGMVDAAGNIVGMVLPGFKQGSALVRAGTGAAANVTQEYVTRKAIQDMLETERGKASFAPTMEDLALAGLAGGTMAALAGKPKPEAPPTPRLQNALTELNTPKPPVKEIAEAPLSPMENMARQLGAEETPVQGYGERTPIRDMVDTLTGVDERAKNYQPTPRTPEQVQMFDQFEERSPVSKYQTEMAPDMWRVDENGIPIRADLSMEVQNLQQPLQRNLFGDELDVNFPRDPNATLVDMPMVRDTDLENNSRPLTEAIDAMPEGVRNRENGKFAPGTTRQSALDRLRGELPADAALETAKMDADIKQWIAENDKPKNEMAARFAKTGRAKKQGGGLLIGDKKVSIVKTDDGFEARIGDKVVGHLRSNITPEQRAQLGETANVDLVRVDENMRGKGVGAALYDAWDKANGGNVAPSGKTSPDAWKVWKRDNPGAVDKFVQQEAERIRGGADPQLVLGNITDPEVAQRVQARTALMGKQSGAIAPDVFVKDFPEFLKSKMVDATGKLKRFYHGTSKDTPFTDIKAGPRGAFFSDDPKAASDYAKDNDSRGTKYNPETRRYEEVNANPHVHEVYLNVQNPYVMDDADMAKYKVAENYAKFQKDLTTKAKSLGYDGIDWGGGVVSAFDKGQIKSTISPKKVPFNFKKQGGGLKINWSDKPTAEVMAKVPGIKEKLKNLIPITMTADEAIAAAKSAKDVDQNIAQKAVNLFTKGGLYQAEKTGNPIIKFVVDKMLNADRLARADIRDYIHDSLAPAMRDLSTVERTEIATVLNQADMNKVEVTTDFLRKHGFSEKQITFAEAHKRTMDAAFERINAARAAAGKEPIDRRVAYSAMNATGDFRKRVYITDESGNKVVVGIIGAKTKWGLASIEKKMKAQHPEYIIESQHRYIGSTSDGKARSTVTAIQQALEMLSENSPATKEFLQVLEDIKTKEAYDYRGQKSHTMGKKGVFGMEGRKPWLSAEQNAKDFMDAQLQYAEAAIKWGHLSDATREANRVLASDVDMPNAKKWAEGYIRNALGVNPTKAGASLEAAINGMWEATGIGHTIPSNISNYSRKAVNTMLLGLNPAFLATNVVQPLLSMPGMTEFLKSRGVDAMTTGYDNIAKAGFTVFKDKFGKLNELEQAARDYAEKHHVYGSELVDTSTVSRKNAEFYLDKTGNFLAGNVESATRQMVYYGFVHMLNDNGIRDFGLAHNLTDMAMNNYAPIERPTIFNALGPIGDIAANLSSFKHNELSRLAMFAREIGKEGDARPFLMQIATGVAAAGITGSIAFAEADWLYRQITKALGKPDSLTRVVIDFSEKLSEDENKKYVASHGLFSLMGLDLSKRLGISDVVPNSIGEALFPGGSKLVDVASQGLSTIKDPSEMNLKRLAREMAPGVVTGPMDRAWFSKDTPQGELGLNRRTLEGQVIRNEADKTAKNFGVTGINESVQKQKLWDLKQQGIGYAELRAAVVKKMIDRLHTGKDIPQQMLDNYARYEGDADTLVRELETKLKAGEISAVDAAKLTALNAKSTPQKMQGARTLESLQ